MSNKIYVAVLHKPSGRIFGLNRGYGLAKKLFDGTEKLGTWLQSWDEWLPSSCHRPTWAQGLDKKEFVAKWYEVD